MSSVTHYVEAASVLRGRADECLQLARRLDGASLFDLRHYSGETTWQGPVALDFDSQLAAHGARLDDAIDRLRANALALSAEADELERRAAYLLAVRRAADD